MKELKRKNDIGLDFFLEDTITIAKKLLGVTLTHKSKGGVTAGLIVETEAYLSSNDPACHASKGKNKKNEAMFGPPGTAYVYLIYGNHYCFNVVTSYKGTGEAVLIRALEPTIGVYLMKKRRSPKNKIGELTNGPGKLCQAMGITKENNKVDLLNSPLYIVGGEDYKKNEHLIASSTRIGISKGKDKPWRFYIKNNKFISR